MLQGKLSAQLQEASIILREKLTETQVATQHELELEEHVAELEEHERLRRDAIEEVLKQIVADPFARIQSPMKLIGSPQVAAPRQA